MKQKFIPLLLLSLLTLPLLAKEESLSMKLIHHAQKVAGEIQATTLKKMIDNEESFIILDIREIEHKVDGEIYADDTYAITRGNLEFDVMSKIKDKDALIVTYCRGGKRGALAAYTLRQLGYKNATSLKGGLRAWAQAGLPLETGLGVTVLSKDN